MAGNSTFGGSVKLTGESEYKQALSSITQNLKVVSAEMKATTTAFDAGDKSEQDLTQASKSMSEQLSKQKDAIAGLKNSLAQASAEYDKAKKSNEDLAKTYDAEKKKLEEIEKFRRGEWASASSLDGALQLHEPQTPFYPVEEKNETPVYSTIQLPDGSFAEVMRRTFPSDFLPEGARVFRLLETDMAPVLNKGALVAVSPGTAVEDGDIVAVFAGRELQFRRAQRKAGGWILCAQRPQAQEERFLADEQWPLNYYGKAVWAFQPLS